MSATSEALASRVPNARHCAVIASGGAAVLVGTLAAAFVWPHAVLRSYLFGYVFWLNVSLGALGWLTLGHVTGGVWGRSTRRYAEAAAGVLPVLAVLGLPLVIGAHHLYAWADAGEWQSDPVLLHRRPWVSTPWVAGRAAVAFAAWSFVWWSLRRASLAQDRATDGDTLLTLGQRMRTISQGGLPLLFIGVFLMSVDWIMSLEPHWYSSIFGLVILMGQATTAIAGIIFVLWFIERRGGGLQTSPERVHDLGKLLLTSLVLWAYVSFMQYLVQWMGHTQEDLPWYTHRLHGGWSWVAAALCVLHLGVPLMALISKPLKRSLASLAVIAAWVFGMRVVDILWTIAPSGPHDTVGLVYVSDPLLWLGVGGVWAGVFLWLLGRAPLHATAYLTSGTNVSGVVVRGGAAGVADG